MPTVEIKNLQGQVVGSLTAAEPVFSATIKTPVVWQTVKGYLANRRQGTADTKTRSEVRGGGRKPWKQKGTGRARAGSIRSPLWRGGGVIFGPHPRDYRVRMPKTMRRTALLSSLEARWRDGAITVVTQFQVEAPKTKAVAQALKTLQAKGSTLIVVEAPDARLALAARNVRGITVKPAAEVTAHDVLAHRSLIVSEAGWRQFQALRPAPEDAPPRPSGQHPAPNGAPVRPSGQHPAPNGAPVRPSGQHPAPNGAPVRPSGQREAAL